MGPISRTIVLIFALVNVAQAQTSPDGLIGIEGDGAYHAYAPSVAVSAGLPSQSGETDNCLKTNGANLSWGACGSRWRRRPGALFAFGSEYRGGGVAWYAK